MDKIIDIAKRHNLIVIEDAAQAFDSKGKVVKNKGTTLYSELTDYIIFNFRKQRSFMI